jgi:hypothetical protein
LRALGRVLGDLASLGFDAQWHGLRAADVGAPHGRSRVFLIAYPAGHPDVPGLEGRRLGAGGAGERATSTPSGEPTLLPTPATDPSKRTELDWGVYADAITRWQSLTRPAPPPTQPSKKGTPQLSPKFSEWMMGLPDGWVTGVPGITRNEALKAIGNGVCPQQAAAALRFLLAGQPVAALPRPAVLFDTPDTRPDAPNAGSNRKAQVAGLGNQVAALLPTPRASDGEKGGPNQRGSSGDLMLPAGVLRLDGGAA